VEDCERRKNLDYSELKRIKRALEKFHIGWWRWTI